MTPEIGQRVFFDLPGVNTKVGTITEGPMLRYGKTVFKVTLADPVGGEASIWLWPDQMRPLLYGLK